MSGAFVRPTPDEWRTAWPYLKERGNYLVGPCPAGCGGDNGGLGDPTSDRFSVSLSSPHPWNCRKCPKGDGMAPLKAVDLFGKRSDEPYRAPRPPRPPQPVVEPYVPACIPFSLRDLARAPVWIGVWDKLPLQWRYRGAWIGWRYSRPEGVAVARFGGEVETRYGPLQLLPWTSAKGVNRVLAKYGQIESPRQLCLSGDAKTKYSFDVAVIDFDIHSNRTSKKAMAWRDDVASRLEDAGCPLSTSAGGLGFHSLVRVDHAEWDGKVNAPVDVEAGLAVEVIPPGAKAAVALDLAAMAEQSEWDAPIPRLSRSELVDVMTGNNGE